ncbi:hypothetical protein Q3G72_002398 [Acer saccharum]|nr:hypothetical protein Q3G72_002398 [Acer saccharum]
MEKTSNQLRFEEDSNQLRRRRREDQLLFEEDENQLRRRGDEEEERSELKRLNMSATTIPENFGNYTFLKELTSSSTSEKSNPKAFPIITVLATSSSTEPDFISNRLVLLLWPPSIPIFMEFLVLIPCELKTLDLLLLFCRRPCLVPVLSSRTLVAQTSSSSLVISVTSAAPFWTSSPSSLSQILSSTAMVA